jgi:hypothetical protein
MVSMFFFKRISRYLITFMTAPYEAAPSPGDERKLTQTVCAA